MLGFVMGCAIVIFIIIITSFRLCTDGTERKKAGSMRNRYGSKWKKKRAAILRRDGYRSQIAARYGRNVPGDTVHHILPVEVFPEYMYTNWNLITITAAEHNRLHDRDTNRLTYQGLELARRTAARRGMNVPEVMEKLTGAEDEEDGEE